jgi:hypothetical protein
MAFAIEMNQDRGMRPFETQDTHLMTNRCSITFISDPGNVETPAEFLLLVLWLVLLTDFLRCGRSVSRIFELTIKFA